jgi:predicted amidohydrolase YtcJ
MARADLLLTGGRVWAGLGLPPANAIAITGERVLAVGAAADLAEFAGPGTRHVDLAGRLLLPGFDDAHQHLLPYGVSLVEVDVRPVTAPTLEGFLKQVRARAESLPPGTWVIGRGYDHFRLDVGRHPTRWELDRAAPNNPVFIKRTCGHLAVLNSAGLAAAGITLGSGTPDGGMVERENGLPTGLIAERALELVADVLPAYPLDTLVRGIEAAGRLCLAQGITSVGDAGVGFKQGWDDYLAYRRALAEDRLPVRANLCFSAGPAGILERAIAEGLISGQAEGLLRIGPAKLITDGSAGGRTAFMSEPYLGPDCGCGVLCLTPDYLSRRIPELHALGWQLAVHAIGDQAIQIAIDAMKAGQRHAPLAGRRHRIEHCGFITMLQIAEMARHGIEPVPQPVFMVDFGDLYVDVLGPARTVGAYPMRAWMEAGLRPAASSDCPVSATDPFVNLWGMVTRRTSRGTVLGANQALGLDEALHAMTANGAHVAFAEAERGRLEPGMLADFCVVDRDLFGLDPAEWAPDVAAPQVDLTALGGRVLHDRHGEIG